MSHLPILPILIPFVTAALLLMLRGSGTTLVRAVSLASVVAVVAVSALLVLAAHDGAIQVYRVGNWPAPYGIVLVVDRLSALMVALTAMLALPVVLASINGADKKGPFFHAFVQFEIAGINGAFLTGDLFNLFVFFEILLLASYGLLVHGGGLERVKAGLAYVVLNLAGSALFLIALGLIYGTLGTLTMADIAVVLPRVGEADQALVRTAMALLVAVFLLKAALLPLGFWLPHVYTAAMAPVGVLFVILTKVGIYALLRVSAGDFAAAPYTAGLLQPWLTWFAIGTIAIGTAGALAAKRFAVVVANQVLISSGIMLLAVGAGGAAATTAMLYYLAHTTIVTGGLFLLNDAIVRRRGTLADTLEKGPLLQGRAWLGGVYLVLAVAACGLPPMSGFLGKLMLMQSLGYSGEAFAAWAALLLSGLVIALVFARAASAFFWEPGKGGTETGDGIATATSCNARMALMFMVTATVLITVAAAPISHYARAAAEQLAARDAYTEAVFGAEPRIERERRP